MLYILVKKYFAWKQEKDEPVLEQGFPTERGVDGGREEGTGDAGWMSSKHTRLLRETRLEGEWENQAQFTIPVGSQYCYQKNRRNNKRKLFSIQKKTHKSATNITRSKRFSIRGWKILRKHYRTWGCVIFQPPFEIFSSVPGAQLRKEKAVRGVLWASVPCHFHTNTEAPFSLSASRRSQHTEGLLVQAGMRLTQSCRRRKCYFTPKSTPSALHKCLWSVPSLARP